MELTQLHGTRMKLWDGRSAPGKESTESTEALYVGLVLGFVDELKTASCNTSTYPSTLHRGAWNAVNSAELPYSPTLQATKWY